MIQSIGMCIIVALHCCINILNCISKKIVYKQSGVTVFLSVKHVVIITRFRLYNIRVYLFCRLLYITFIIVGPTYEKSREN